VATADRSIRLQGEYITGQHVHPAQSAPPC
jgi:hypothetical protein